MNVDHLSKTTAAIEIDSLRVQYGTTLALEQLNLSIPKNRVSVLIGPSGCGKSTTLRCINGLVTPTSGSIRYEGSDIGDIDGTELRRSMGYAIQNVGLLPHMTVEQNVSLVPKLLGTEVSQRQRRAHELLTLVGLDPQEYAGKFPHQLSGGESQRVGVARALGADPPVLLMDEPFGAVDPLNREVLQDEFVSIQRKLKKTVVFVTHDIDEAVRLADYLIIMKEGRLVQADSPEEILARPADDFVERFLGPDRAIKRLSLYTADRSMESFQIEDQGTTEVSSGSIDMDKEASTTCRWVLDEKGVPVEGRFFDGNSDVQREVVLGSHSVFGHASLKECMSRLLSFGLPAIPVINENGTMIGELRYESIQSISSDSGNT